MLFATQCPARRPNRTSTRSWQDMRTTHTPTQRRKVRAPPNELANRRIVRARHVDGRFRLLLEQRFHNLSLQLRVR
jgi:hypothetical protein